MRSAWQDLCEKDDRTSPAEHPDMCLITEAELNEIEQAAEQRGIERAAKYMDERGASSCERGATDPSTGAFECRRADRGECNCFEFDEAAEHLRGFLQTKVAADKPSPPVDSGDNPAGAVQP